MGIQIDLNVNEFSFIVEFWNAYMHLFVYSTIIS